MNAELALRLWRKIIPDQRTYVLDVGAHDGKHSRVMSQILPVVALEPNPWRHPTEPAANITWVSAAVSDRNGVGRLQIDREHDYMSTLEEGYPRQVEAHSAEYFRRSLFVSVATLTLDNLVDALGVPAFAKVDVEGHERAVFRGLSYPLPALSFEVHDFDPDKAREVIGMLGELGDYSYAYSRRESFVLEPLDLDNLDLFGDVYATLGGSLL